MCVVCEVGHITQTSREGQEDSLSPSVCVHVRAPVCAQGYIQQRTCSCLPLQAVFLLYCPLVVSEGQRCPQVAVRIMD